MTSLIIFLSSVLLLAIAFALAFRPVFKRMVGVAADMVPTYAQAYLKCTVSMIIAAGICFRETWQPVTTAQAAGFNWWDWTIFLGAPLLAALINLNAFLDRSLERADAAKAVKQSTVSTTTTAVITKESTPTNPPIPTP